MTSRSTSQGAGRLLLAVVGLVCAAVALGLLLPSCSRDDEDPRRLAPAGPPLTVPIARTSFYVDAEDGSDAHSGRSAGQAWRTLRRVSAARLQPGDHVLLRRGRSWQGTLRLRHSGLPNRPIVIAAYGEGDLPRISRGEGTPPPRRSQGYVGAGRGSCIRIEGSDVMVIDLELRRCRPARAGIESRGDRNVLARLLISHNEAGVVVDARADDNRVLFNTLRSNNLMTVDTCGRPDDYGSYSIVLEGSTRTEVAYNFADGARARSCDYGGDGSMVEIFKGSEAHVHHNVSIDNQTFAEVGGAGAVGNRFSFNQIFAERPDSAAGFIVHGAGTFGGARRTVLDHNSVRLLGSESVALSCFERCGPKILRVRDNVFSADSPAKSPASFDEDRNLFSAGVGFELGRESLVADPLFASPRGVRLRAASPAARAGFGALSEEPRGER